MECLPGMVALFETIVTATGIEIAFLTVAWIVMQTFPTGNKGLRVALF